MLLLTLRPLTMMPGNLQVVFASGHSAHSYSSKDQADWLLCEQAQSSCARALSAQVRGLVPAHTVTHLYACCQYVHVMLHVVCVVACG